MTPDCTAVRTVTKEVLGEIFSGPLGEVVRCHEIARLLAPQLRERFNCPVRICDGAVRYRADFLWQQSQLDMDDGTDDELMLLVRQELAQFKPKQNQFCGTIHSWCEVGPAGDIVVDYHNLLVASDGQFGFGNLLIVTERAELTGIASYKRCGLAFTIFGRSFLLLPRVILRTFIIPYVTRIKLS